MQVFVEFDEQTLYKYSKRHAPLFFNIWLEHEDVSYPNRGWTDFGAVILDWWLSNLAALILGQDSCELGFMDGPYSIKVTRNTVGDKLQLSLKGLTQNWEIETLAFVDELCRISNQVCREFMRLNIGQQEQTALQRGIVVLREAFRRNQQPLTGKEV